MTLSKSQPWATLYQPRNLIPYFSPYSLAWRGNSVFMKNLKNGSRPRRTEKYVARTGTGWRLLEGGSGVGLFWHARLVVPGGPLTGPLVLDLADGLGPRGHRHPALLGPPIGGHEPEQEDDGLPGEQQ